MTADPSWEVPEHSIQISVDRGGTFSDVHASFPRPGGAAGERDEVVLKLLSVDTNNYPDAPTVSWSALRAVMLPAEAELEADSGWRAYRTGRLEG